MWVGPGVGGTRGGALTPSYFLRVSSNFFSFGLVNPTEMITGFPFSGCKKAYFKCSSNSLSIKPFELLFSSAIFLYNCWTFLRYFLQY